MSLEIIITAIATLIASLGLPHLYKSLFSHLSDKRKYDSEYELEIQKLKRRMIQIETAVDMLLIVIKGEHQKNPHIIKAIERVESHLQYKKNETTSNSNSGSTDQSTGRTQ